MLNSAHLKENHLSFISFNISGNFLIGAITLHKKKMNTDQYR